MVRSEIVNKVFEIVSKTSKKPISELQETTTFEELKLDSLDTVDIMMNLSDEFSHDIPDDEVKNFITLEHIISYIEKNV